MDPATVGTASPGGTRGRSDTDSLSLGENCSENHVAVRNGQETCIWIEEERKMPQGFMQHAHIFIFASEFSKRQK
ncbi:hypothetical protein CDAR_395201 [Caerostris darwini]|uniref:Uncharacterized protein n=1 Tax=Caerostris darwini TaxID=1538125 RepID=A0AAV4QE76_9ARAC|nr:hypothetical protein CDAR_395201 [Caerostris darwini]